MNLIIDTHVFLWSLADPEQIEYSKRHQIESMANRVYVSAVSIAEIAIKSSLGKLQIDFDPVQQAKDSGYDLLDFSADDAWMLKDLPFHHKDPFDRMLIAQSIARNFYIVSDDAKFLRYDCKLIS